MVLQDSPLRPRPLNHQELNIDLLQDILNFPPTFNCFHTNDDQRHNKMISNSGEKDFPAKKEGEIGGNKITKGSSSSRQWLGLKDPRVVRVSRSFGGKDRHSKVCTIRGLRDRRVRLSVPTAIQLYDLQDRIGLNQPSKVVDWLLNAAKHEIDELPPLQIPPGNFGQFPRSMIVPDHEGNGLQSSLASIVDHDASIDCVKDDGSHRSLLPSRKEVFKINNIEGDEEDQTILMPKSAKWNLNDPLRSKCKEVAQETIKEIKSNWFKRNEHESQEDDVVEIQNAQVYNNPLSRSSNSSFPAGLLNNIMPYYHWDPSNLSLSNLGYSNQSEDPHNYNVVSLPSASQLLLCPSATQPSFFPPYVTTQVECNPRQINNHFQMLSSSSSQNLLANSLTPNSLYSISPLMRPPQLTISTPHELLHSLNNNNGNQSTKVNSGPSSSFASGSFQNDPN